MGLARKHEVKLFRLEAPLVFLQTFHPVFVVNHIKKGVNLDKRLHGPERKIRLRGHFVSFFLGPGGGAPEGDDRRQPQENGFLP